MRGEGLWQRGCCSLACLDGTERVPRWGASNHFMTRIFLLLCAVIWGVAFAGERVVKEEVVPVREGKEAGELYVNGLGMAFRWCPAGEFEMGSGKAEQEMAKTWGRDSGDEVRHRVKLTRGYWMQEMEVSQGDWKRVMGSGLRAEVEGFLRSEQEVNVGQGKMMKVRDFYGAKVGEDVGKFVGVEDEGYPMIFVDWEGARAYCEALTQKEREGGRIGAGWRYELPTEAQWEYACRAGSKEEVYGGKMSVVERFNAPVLDRIAWYGGNSAVGYPGAGIYSRGKVYSSAGFEGLAYAGGVCGPRKCGEKRGNSWGLKDMIGNVWEWCVDWYGEYGVKAGEGVVDPRGAGQGVKRVNRGGGWSSHAVSCRSANRNGGNPALRDCDLGFRPALVPSGEIAISGSKGDSLASNQVRLEIGLGRRVTESQAQTRDSSLTPGASQGENGRAKPKDAGITQGDIFPVQVQEVFDPDGKPEKSESMEYWALKFNSDFSKGELLVIVQVEAMGQKYPLYHMYPFSDVIRGDNTLTLRVKQASGRISKDHHYQPCTRREELRECLGDTDDAQYFIRHSDQKNI
jgi:formylglycine-generating enzyme required for sulfatase activity